MKIFKKEHEVTEAAFEYLEAVEKCVTAAEAAILKYIAGEVDEDPLETHDRINRLEAKADGQRRSIGDMLFSGAYLPLMRGDIFSLIESIDSVPNAAESCTTLVFTEKPFIPEEFKDAFSEITRDSFGTIIPLKKVVKAFFKPKGKADFIREGAGDIGSLETAVDQKELTLTLRIFESASLELSSRMHLRKLLSRIVEISDRAEDVADHLALIAIKSVN